VLRIDKVGERGITLLHVDERAGSPARYHGVAIAPILVWLASAICTRFKNSGIAVESSRGTAEVLPRVCDASEWHRYDAAKAPVYSFYAPVNGHALFVPSSKEQLDRIVPAAYPDLDATLTVFRDYRSLFGVDERSLQQRIDECAVCSIGAETGIFSLQGLRSDVDFHELVLGAVSEINQYLN
jgi:hypothetical protein